jgi:hypothetical protein
MPNILPGPKFGGQVTDTVVFEANVVKEVIEELRLVIHIFVGV